MKVRIKKFNENHDELGRFSSAGGGNRIISQIANDPALNKLATSGGTTAKVLQQMDAGTQKKFALACAGATVQPAPMDIDISFGAGGMRKIAVRHLTVDGETIATEVTTTRHGRSETSRCSTDKADVAGHLGSAFSDLEYSGQQITMTRSRNGKVVKSEDTAIEKFNPFHDEGGRFSNHNGFTSFSANPYTKAGQMAIQRAANGKGYRRYYQYDKITGAGKFIGGGRIANVHANSKTSSSTGAAHTTSENVSYLRGKRILIVGNNLQSVGGTAAANKLMRAAMNEPLPPKGAPKPATQTQAKPKQQAKPKPQAQQQQNQNGQQNQQAPSQQQNQTQQAATSQNTSGQPLRAADYAKMTQRQLNQIQQQNSQDVVRSQHVEYQGKDMRAQAEALPDLQKNRWGKFDDDVLKERYNQICDMQGFHEIPKAVDNMVDFAAAAKDSGVVMYRSKGHDTYIDAYADAPKFTESGNGGTAYSIGTYFASNATRTAGTTPDSYQQSAASNNSYGYGPRQIAATVSKTFKIVNQSTLERQFAQLDPKTRANKYGNEIGLFAAAKGVDCHLATSHYASGKPYSYLIVHNRSKVIVNKHTNRSTGKLENTYSRGNFREVR